MAGGIFQKIS